MRHYGNFDLGPVSRMRINFTPAIVGVALLLAAQACDRSVEPDQLDQRSAIGHFEILVDLVFVQSGWRRLSALGKTQKRWDLDLVEPVTGERAKVQVKSRSNARELTDHIKEFRKLKTHRRLFFIVHSFDGELPRGQVTSPIHVVGPHQLAELVVGAGLADWLIKRNS